MYFNRDFLHLTLLICLNIATTKFYQPEKHVTAHVLAKIKYQQNGQNLRNSCINAVTCNYYVHCIHVHETTSGFNERI